ncbi:PREDICTED: telomere repeat-binding protein 2-like [Tarenaya hassleriana]|uniref:telomere repeat-binding protein 2-like n=1 Tax=Tarenaya hassleriana TaxID=28532 RepID=UPI0008FCF4A6|nr:PREDICTED: telomere repeat-binding protein 2-like [Tarenaya hassleriana]
MYSNRIDCFIGVGNIGGMHLSHKRLEFGDNGYQLPANARARRSARKKRCFKKNNGDDDRMGAFDLLATVAGSLLLEKGSSQPARYDPIHLSEDKSVAVQNTVRDEFLDEEKPLKAETFCGDNHSKGSSGHCHGLHCGTGTIMRNPGDSLMSEKLENVVEGFGNPGQTDSCKVGNFDQGFKAGIDGDAAVVLEAKPDVVVSLGCNNSSSRAELPACGKDASHGSRDVVNLVSSDDDENFLAFSHCSRSRQVPRIGDRRIRKIWATRHRKGGLKNADVKPWYSAKRNYCLHHQRNYPIKKRKFFDNISELNSDDYHLPPKMGRGSRTIFSMKCRNGSYVSRDPHVRLRIKSFRVPELFIEIPETATVGSLKRMVMEAVTTLLGGGLRVGLMLQGKKLRDDSKTLLQTGISQDNTHLDSMGFCLEPSSEAGPIPCDTPKPLTRYPPVDIMHACDDLPICRAADLSHVLESDHDSAPSPDVSYGEKNRTDDSRALFPMEAAVLASRELTKLAARPPDRKSKRPEQQQAAQRRIRRPFSVGEVEALVQAVEKLGTGRWRDIKRHAFEGADHRTYVDLKDKWKTLVHTARIAPQQRRGEPVPHELLDRVLTAHSFWSQSQPPAERLLLL